MNSNVQMLAPSNSKFLSLCSVPPLLPFNDLCLDFVEKLSTRLLKQSNSDLVALGFWLRSTNIKNMRKNFSAISANQPTSYVAKPLGIVSHFTPTNVDTMFIYSWVCSLLMGNNNVVRLATKETKGSQELIDVLDELLLLPECSEIASRNQFVRYDKFAEIGKKISLVSDARVVWGGDESVLQIRSMVTKPRCRDISFADRYSASIIDIGAGISEKESQSLAKLIWRDTQPHGQQACSSPRVIFWLGDEQPLIELFNEVNKLAQNTEHEITRSNNHLVNRQLVQSLSEHHDLLMAKNITLLKVGTLSEQLLQWHSGEGIFYVIKLAALGDLAANIDAKLQTLSYWGIDKDALLKISLDPSISGIDRMIPVGQALDFSPIWDGFDLFSQLTRRVTIL